MLQFLLRYLKFSISVLALLFVASSSFGQGESEMALTEEGSMEDEGEMYKNRVMIDVVRPLNRNIAVSYGRKFSDIGLRLNFSWVPKEGGWPKERGENFLLKGYAIYPFLSHPSRNLFKWTSSIQSNYYFMNMNTDAVGIYMSFLAGGFEHKANWVVADPCLGDCGFSGDVTKRKWTPFYMLGLGAGVEARISDRFFLNSDLETGFYNPFEKKGEYMDGLGSASFMFFQSIDIGYRF